MNKTNEINLLPNHNNSKNNNKIKHSEDFEMHIPDDDFNAQNNQNNIEEKLQSNENIEENIETETKEREKKSLWQAIRNFFKNTQRDKK